MIISGRNSKNEKLIGKYLLSMIVLLTTVIIISACVPSSNSTTLIYKGTEGVTIEFLKSSPKEVFTEDNFAISLFLRNIGAYDIKDSDNAKMSISYDEYYLSLNTNSGVINQQPLNIVGRSKNNPIGGEDYMEFPFTAKKFDVQRDSVKTQVSFNLCYPYRTTLTTDMCIDTKVTSSDERAAACTLKTYSSKDGQGAPISIVKIEPQMIIQDANNVRPQFLIYIENSNDGYVIKKADNKPTCSDIDIGRTSPDLNKISIKASLSGEELECNPSEIRLKTEAENMFRCYAKTASVSRTAKNYATTLTVTLDYGYIIIENHELTIKRSQSYNPLTKQCGYYEKEINGECVSLCDYCAKNPSANECKKNIPTTQFKFTQDFGCYCGKAQCLKLNAKGECIFGYCSGSTYCCNVNECTDKADGTQCGDNNVCINGKCDNTKTECDYSYGNQNFKCMNKNECVVPTIKTGLCPGNVDFVCCVKTGENTTSSS